MKLLLFSVLCFERRDIVTIFLSNNKKTFDSSNCLSPYFKWQNRKVRNMSNTRKVKHMNAVTLSFSLVTSTHCDENKPVLSQAEHCHYFICTCKSGLLVGWLETTDSNLENGVCLHISKDVWSWWWLVLFSHFYTVGVKMLLSSPVHV